MVILGIETSCDETSAGIVEKVKNIRKVKLLSNIVTSSLPLHSKTGGIIPESAAREQLRFIIPVIEKAIDDSKIKIKNIDAIAITVGPGLLGSLLVGVETAKTLSYVWKKPLIPVNHLIGHIYANFVGGISNFEFRISNFSAEEILFPAVCLIVSGGHTDLILMFDHGRIKWLGGTRDDAAGEAFDKIGRLLDLPYPGGPSIEKASLKGDPNVFNFPRPMIGSSDFDFSFSGLKTAVLREVKAMKQLNNETIYNMCASVQQAIIDVLVTKTLKAAQKYNVKSILLGGGVAANQKLRDEFKFKIENLKLKILLSVPPKYLCTDNSAMIAAAAAFNLNPTPLKKIQANPELYFD